MDWDMLNFIPYSPALYLLLISLCAIYAFLTRNYNHWQSRGIACAKPALLFGNMWEVVAGRTQVAKFLGKLYSQYTTEPYFGIYIFDKPYLVLRDPKLIKKVLIEDFHNFSDRIFACDKNADPISGNSVFLLRNPRWRDVRAKLTSIFTSSKLKFMLPIMRDVGEEMTEYLSRFDGEIIDAKEISARYMTDVTALCFFGFKTNSFEDGDNVFRTVGRKLFDFNVLRTSLNMFAYFFVPPLVSLFKLTFTDVESTQFMARIFAQAIAERQDSNAKRNDFVDLLLSLKDKGCTQSLACFDDDTMISQAITFFLAGFESTSNVISFTLYELSLHEEVQSHARSEILEVLQNDEEVTFEKVQQMKYLDMVLAEALRKYPFAPFLNRKCKDNYPVAETGFTIEKGTEILIPTDGIHFDPQYFPDPDNFIPERFSTDLKFTTDVYMPFGAGPRFCIGDRFGLITAKVSLVYFLKSYIFRRCERTPVPLVLNPRSPFVMSNEGLPMSVEKIDC